MQTLFFWLVVRVLTSIWAALISHLRPLSALEKSVPLWPPTELTHWLERALLNPWLRWDALWYVKIITQGYKPDDGSDQFHPLYPWLASLLVWLGAHPLLSLLIVSGAAAILFLLAFERLAKLDLPQKELLQQSVLLTLFFPPAFILFTPYPEALFLLLSVLCLYLARQRKWWLAGICGGLASLTRQQGIFLLFPLAWELWESSEKNLKRVIRQGTNWLSLILVPGGYAAWLVYRAVALGYRAVALRHLSVNLNTPTEFIYSFLISSSAYKVIPIQTFTWPWKVLWLAGKQLIHAPDVDLWTNLVGSSLFIFFLVASWKNMRMSYRIYSVLITLVSFSYYTGPTHPYMGLLRHLYLAFPVFIGAAPILNRPWKRALTLGLSFIGSMYLVMVYVLEAWVP